MKKAIILFLSISLLSACSLMKKQTKKASPEASAAFDTTQLKIKVAYSSPSKKGRLIFGEEKDKALQPYGKYWRLGANEATWIEFSDDVIFGGKDVKAGKYSIYAYPGPEEWEIALGKKWDVWGYEEPKKRNEVLRIKVIADNNAPIRENLRIGFDESIHLIIHWDTVELKIPIKKK